MSNKKNVDYNPLSIDEDFYITPREVKPREFSQEQEEEYIAYLKKNLFDTIWLQDSFFVLHINILQIVIRHRIPCLNRITFGLVFQLILV